MAGLTGGPRVRRPHPNTRRRSEAQRRIRTIVAVLGGVVIWFAVAPPGFIRPDPPPPPPEPMVEAGLRMDVSLVAGALIGHRDRTGRLPYVLVDALVEPELAEGMTWSRIDDRRFEIRATRSGVEVVYTSDQSLDDFTAEARRRLQGIGER